MKRKAFLFIPLLLLIGWSFYLPTRTAAPVGKVLLGALPTLPQAIATLEYFPPASRSLPAPGEPLIPVAFASPDPSLRIDEYRLEAARLIIPRGGVGLLRARLTSAETDATLRAGLREMGYRFDAPDQFIAAARKTLLAETDAALLQEYLRADRYTLGQTADLDRAVQLAMLLVTTPLVGAAATFQVGGRTYYLLSTRDDRAVTPATGTVLCFASDGQEVFHAVLEAPKEALLPTLYRFAQRLPSFSP